MARRTSSSKMESLGPETSIFPQEVSQATVSWGRCFFCLSLMGKNGEVLAIGVGMKEKYC